MRSHPSCWNKTLTKLGFKRKLRKKSKRHDYLRRRSRFENLEQRQMLASDLYTITTLDDVAVVGTTTDNQWSLREALAHSAADTEAGQDTIEFAGGLTGTLQLNGTQLTIDSDVTINGPGADFLTIDANGASRVFSVGSSGSAGSPSLSGMRLVGASFAAVGGSADITISEVEITNNSRGISVGGGELTVIGSEIHGNSDIGIFVDSGTADIRNSTIAENERGVSVSFGSATIKNSTISNNTSDSNVTSQSVAGVSVSSGSATIENSTISGNISGHGVAGLSVAFGNATVINSTIAENHSEASNSGSDTLPGGVWVDAYGTVTIHNTIVSGNVSGADESRDVGVGGGYAGYVPDGEFSISSSHNLIGVDTDSNFFTNLGQGNQIGVDPMLADLAYNGGQTRTHALLPGSPAINAGNNLHAAGLATDQRGFNRFVGLTDIGAYELGLRVSTTDGVDDGDYSAGNLSLREALFIADILPGKDIIEFDLDFTNPQTITLSGTQLTINSDVTITGPGADLLTISANNQSRVLLINAGNEVEISGVTIADGRVDATTGGGIFNRGSLTLEEVTVRNNTAVSSNSGGGGQGGGIYNENAALTVRNSTFDGNSARFGGAIRQIMTSPAAADVQILGSTFINNRAEQLNPDGHSTYNSGGGVSVHGGNGTTLIANSTFSGNSALHSAAVRGHTYADIHIVNSTISENHATGNGGGLGGVVNAEITVQNSIVAGNTSGNVGHEDVSFQSNILQQAESTHNIIGVNTGGYFDSTTNTIGQDPMLAPLGSYGGATLTYALMSGSPAFDSANRSWADAAGLTSDQTGVPRSIDDPGIGDEAGVSFGLIPINTGANETTDNIVLEVNTVDDEFDSGVPGFGELLSLREALALAQSRPGDDEITFDPSVFGSTNTIELDQSLGALKIGGYGQVRVLGPGTDLLTIDANGAPNAIEVVNEGVDSAGNGLVASLSDLTVTGSSVGAIFSDANLTLESVIVTGNDGAGIIGSGFFSFGNFGDGNYQLHITNTQIAGNLGKGIASSYGSINIYGSDISNNSSGISSDYGTVTIHDTTIAGSSGTGIRHIQGNVSLFDSTISGHSNTGIRHSNGRLTVTRSDIVNNHTSGSGGGIHARAINSTDYSFVTITDSTIANNSAVNSGGGIYGNRSNIIVINSTLSENSVTAAGSTGGGLSLTGLSGFSSARASISNSTISGNSAGLAGGAIAFGNGVYDSPITNSTIAHNTATRGGGIYTYNSGRPILNHTIVANNFDDMQAANDIDGMVEATSSHNIVGVVNNSNLVHDPGGTGNQLLGAGADFGLSELGNYGGPTQTHALLPGSPAIDAGNDTHATAYDQRGFQRNINSGDADTDGNTVDIGAYEFESFVGTGDVNGDGREDNIGFDFRDNRFYTFLDYGSHTEVEDWGQIESATETSNWTQFYVGDFNGDGRDDLLAFDDSTDTWTIAISDSTRFFFSSLAGSNWSASYVGDFDGDGSDELVGRASITDNWQLLDVDERFGSRIQEDFGNTLAATSLSEIYVGDANRDGRDDLIAKRPDDDPGWNVALSVPGSGNSFELASSNYWGDWFDNYFESGVLDADGPYRKLTETFADVYNNVELELYAGIKKGPDATENTQSGNPWDQAGLLVQRLEDAINANELPAEVAPTIVGGRVTVPLSIAKDWLGAKSEGAVSDLLASMDMQAIAGGVVLGNQDGVDVVTFDHAWVQVTLPTEAGLTVVDLDPSWKFKDYQQGLPLDDLFDSATGEFFDEFGYLESTVELLSSSSTANSFDISPETPLEFLEGKIQQHLVETLPGTSLADIPFDGPLKNHVFDVLPLGLGAGIINSASVLPYGTLAEINANPSFANDLTYRFRFSAVSTKPVADSTLSGVDYIEYELTETEPIVHFTTDTFALHTHGLTEWAASTSELTGSPSAPPQEFSFELTADGTIIGSGIREAGTSTPHPRLYVELYAPGESLPSTPLNDQQIQDSSYVHVLLEPNSSYAIGFDINQYSQADIQDYTARLRDAAADDDPNDNTDGPEAAYDELTALAVTEFLHEKNRSLQLIAGLTSTHYQLDYGFVFAKATKQQADTDSLDIIPFGTLPTSFYINDIDTNSRYLNSDLSGSSHLGEVGQLANWQASAEQSRVHEKLLASDGISTLRLFQRAYAGQQGWETNGPLIRQDNRPSSLLVLQTRVENGYPELYYMGTAAASFNNTPIETLGDRIYDGSFPADQQYRVWRSSLKLAEINSSNISTIKQELIDNLLSDLFIHSNQQSDGRLLGVNGTLKAELSQYIANLVSFDTNLNIAQFEDTRITLVNDELPIGGWIGSGFHSHSFDGMLGAHYVDRFGDDEVSGAESGAGVGSLAPEVADFAIDASALSNQLASGSSGNSTATATDILFPNIGVPLTFDRNYSSRNTIGVHGNQAEVIRDFGLGVGWAHAFSDRLIVDNPDATNPDLIWVRADGQEHRFSYSSGFYSTPSELLGIFSKTPDNTVYHYFDRDGTRYRFERTDTPGTEAGATFARLSSVVDRHANGFVVNYVDNTVDRIASVEDVHDTGRRLEFTYSPQTVGDDETYRITDVAKYTNGALEGTWTYGYEGIVDPVDLDTRWYLSEVTSPSDGDLIAENEIKTNYSYYNAADDDVFSGLLKRVTHPNGDYREYDYYLNRRMFRETTSANLTGEELETTSRSYSYNLVANTTTIVDERGNVTTTSYQANGLQTRLINPDRTRQTYKWKQDPREEYLLESHTDEVGAVESYEYHPVLAVSGRNLSKTISRQFLDANGVRVVGTNPGIITEYDYRQGTGIDFSQSPAISLNYILDTETVTVIDPDGVNLTTTYNYTYTNRLESISNANGEETTYTYYTDGFKDGLIETQSRPKSDGSDFVTTYDYDQAGNQIHSTTDGIRLSTTSYDHTGQPILVAETGSGVIYESTYDIIGRLHSTRIGDGSGFAGGPNGALSEFENGFTYDPSGQITSSTDRNGNTTTSHYDRRGNVVTKTNPDGTSVQFEYDQSSNLIAQTDELGRTTRFVYDSRNRRIQTIFPDGHVERVIYDGVGRVSAVIDARGNKTSSTYDGDGRLLTTVNANPDTSENTVKNEYDALGRLIWTRDFNGNYTLFKHDDLGRVTETLILDEDDTPSSITHNPEFASTTEYDANGNVYRTAVYDVDRLIADGLTTLTGFLSDPKALLTTANLQNSTAYLQVTETIYDSLDRPIETKYIGAKADGLGQDVSVRTQYDEAGRVEFTFDELNRQTQFFYDAYGRLERTVLPDPDGDLNSGKPSPEIIQAYDDAGNVVSTTDANGHTAINTYDVFNRLVSTTDAEGNTTRTVYDVAGQMVATIDALGRALYMSYDNRGRVKFDRSPDPDGSGPQTALMTEYDYDAVGNRIGMTNVNGYTTTYQYDELNRLVKEFSTDVQIFDIATHDSDLNFSVVDGTPVNVEDHNGSFGLDHVDISGNAGNAPEATWTFDNLELDDKYSISLTWDGNPGLDRIAYAQIDFYDNQNSIVKTHYVPTFDQAEDPQDFALDYQGQWRGWKRLVENISYDHGGTGKIVVTITGLNDTTTIRADAVMLDREVSRQYDYDGNSNLVAETDVLGRQTTNTYDARNLLTSTTLPDPDDTGVLVAPVVEQVYDGYGNIIETIERRGAGTADDRTQTFEYDRRNRLIESVTNYQDGNYDNQFTDQDIITENVYDDVGNLKQVNTAVGSPDETANAFDYDDLNRLTVEYIDVYDSSNANQRIAYNHRNVHEYDAVGNLERTESFTNDSNGTNDPTDDVEASVVSTFEYDKINRLIKQTDDAGNQAYNVNAISRFTYDAVSNILHEIDPTDRITTYEYDRLNRVAKTISPAPDATGVNAPTMEYVYDTLSNVAKATNSEGETTQSIYDTLGREISKFDANLDKTSYHYDAYGNLLSVIDAEDNITDFTYDDLDRVKTDTIYEDNDLTQPLTRTYIYDDALNLKQYVDRNGRGVEYTYDGLDRLTQETWYATSTFSGPDVGTLEWDYDVLGRVTRAISDLPGSNFDHEETWEYDNLGRITLHRNYDPTGGNFNPRVEQAYTYDKISNPNSDDPFLTLYIQSLDSAAFAATSYYSDRLGRVVNIFDRNLSGSTPDIRHKIINFTYDSAGRMRTTERTSGTFAYDTEYQYDGTGRLQNLLHRRNGESSPFTSYSYGYDTASRITQLDRHLDTSIAAFSALTADRTETFQFDEAGQLTERDDNTTTGADEEFEYDENGNRTTANGVSYSTGANNRVANDGTYSYLYDNEGNLVRRDSLDGSGNYTLYEWDHRNRLAAVDVFLDDGAGGTIQRRYEYRYNADDQLVARRSLENSTAGLELIDTEHYVHDGSDQVLELADDGNIRHRRTWGPGVDKLLTDEVFNNAGQPHETLWAANDHLGSVNQLLDINGDIVEHREFDSFGNIDAVYNELGNTKSTASLDSDVAFAGREWEDETQLYYNRARWFDPKLGRFISVDPLGFDAGDANLYRYAGNDPLNRFDPSGQSWLSSIFDTIGDAFEKVGEEVGRVFEDIGEFVIDTVEFVGDHVANTVDAFEYIIKNPEDAFKSLVSDPLVWGSFALGTVFSAGFSWGFFDVGLGLNGLNATPNLLSLGKQALSVATGGGFNFGGPTLNLSSRLFDFTRSIDVGSFLSGAGSSGGSSTYWVTDQTLDVGAFDNNALFQVADTQEQVPVEAWSTRRQGFINHLEREFGRPLTDEEILNYFGSPFQPSGGATSGGNGGLADLQTSLDLASLTPGPAGIGAGLASAGISFSRGDYVGGTLGVLGAIPVVGAIADYARISGKVSDFAGNIKSGIQTAKNNLGLLYVNRAGEILSSSTLARQGTSRLAGNFQGLAGNSIEEIISRVPAGWKWSPQRGGNGLRFFDSAGVERLRLHGPSLRAPVGSNSQSGWTMRIMDRGGNYYDDAGRIVPYRANEGHIPIYGNPNAGR